MSTVSCYVKGVAEHYLDLSLTRRSRQGGVESCSLATGQLTTPGPTTAAVPGEDVALEALTELSGEPPLVEQPV